MPTYLAPDTLKESTERLGDSIAKGTVTDYLVFRRALVNAGAATPPVAYVETGTESKPFMLAMDGVAAHGAPAWSIIYGGFVVEARDLEAVRVTTIGGPMASISGVILGAA